jgi:hypothetical protein
MTDHACGPCGGTGECPACKGTGILHGERCIFCDQTKPDLGPERGSGVCNDCHGTGVWPEEWRK